MHFPSTHSAVRRRTTTVLTAMCWTLLTVEVAIAQLPATRLDGVFPAGAAAGSTVALTVSGNDLDEAIRMTFDHDGITAVPVMTEPTSFDPESLPVANQFTVTVADFVPPGFYEVRVHGLYGLSNPRTFVVTRENEFVETEPNNEMTEANQLSLPATINGQASGGADVDWFRFDGTAGQRLLMEGFARRVDSRMDLAVTVFSQQGQIIAEDVVGADGDSLVDLRLPHDGGYFVKIHDTLFGQGAGYHYRLQIGSFPHLDFVMPPAALPGSNEEFTVYGRNLPGGQPTQVTMDGVPLEELKVRIAIPADIQDKLVYSSRVEPHQAALDGTEYRVEAAGVLSNPVLVTAATAPVVQETDNNRPDSPQLLTLPCEVAGQFYPQRDVDWFQFEAKKDEVWIIDVYSQRLGRSTDPAFLLQRVTTTDAGEQQITDLTFLDDTQMPNVNNRSGRHEFDERTSDPTYTFNVPADGTYRLLLKDGLSAIRTDPRLTYRLAIRRPQHDFRIVAVPDGSTGSLMLRPGGRDMIHVSAIRQDNFNGEIVVTATGLPDGVTCDPVTIGPGNVAGTLIMTAAADAKPVAATVTVAATANVNGQTVTRKARYGAALAPFQFAQGNSNIPSVPARLVNRIQVSVSEKETAPAILTVGGGEAPLETSRGGILKIPYQYTKDKDAGGNMIAVPIDFPPGTTAQQITIGNNEKGEFELRFQAATPPGTYTIYLAGFCQGLQYSRNPEATERAKERQDRIGTVLQDAQKKVQDLQQESQQKQNEITQATTRVSQATARKQQADREAAAADATAKQAAATVAQRQQQTDAAPEDDSLKQQLVTAKQEHETADSKLAETLVTAVQATTAMETAATELKAAQDAKAEIDKQLQESRSFLTTAQQEKQRADQFYSQQRNTSNRKGVNVSVPSNSITVTVTEFPIKVDELPEALKLQQGEKTEITVKISRLYDFKSNVSMQTQLPGGVGGIRIANVNIGNAEAEAKFEVEAQANATPGEHVCRLRMQMNFNGQNLVMERELKLTIAEKPAESQ